METGSSIYDLKHNRVVSSAYFSPVSGNKILTTSLDNRLRVWDSIFGKMDSPSREIVHSHDFNRYLTPFKAEWDPKVFSIVKFVIFQSVILDNLVSLWLKIIDSIVVQLFTTFPLLFSSVIEERYCLCYCRIRQSPLLLLVVI